MNGSCAGGTGAFIDQMATLLKMGADEMDKAAQAATRTYTIASRCGVFAKSDIQPLINQGAQAGDIAASIYQAVVNQTIAGLAQGRPIKGNILYLGGPLTFSETLRRSFDKTLGVTGTLPENSLLLRCDGRGVLCRRGIRPARRLPSVSTTTAPQRPTSACRRCSQTNRSTRTSTPATLKATVPCLPFGADCGPVHIGIDSGSTTVKLVGHRRGREHPLRAAISPNLGNPDVHSCGIRCSSLYREHPGHAGGQRHRHRLRRGAWRKTPSTADYGRGGDGGALHRRPPLPARRGLHHRHRRSGHEVLQDRGRCHQQHLPERSLLLRLRQLFADLRPGAGLRRQGVCRAGPVCRQARGPWQPLHRVHELQSVKQAQKDGASH